MPIVYLVAFFVISVQAYAHEPWLLTPKQMVLLQSQPLPPLFTQLTLQNTFLLSCAFVMLVIWFILGKKGFEEKLFSYLPAYPFLKNSSCCFLRIGTAAMLLLMAFNLAPRVGLEHSYAPALLVPEFILKSTYSSYIFIFEIVTAVLLLTGIGTRIAAISLLCLIGLALYLSGTAFVTYLGFYLGIAIYILSQDRGDFSLLYKKKTHPALLKTSTSLFILRILTGMGFIYSAITYKLLNPHYIMSIFLKAHAYSFGFSLPTFTFILFIVEFCSGILIVLGSMLRLLAFILLLLFIFMSWNVQENIFAHSFLYGILLTFIFSRPNQR